MILSIPKEKRTLKLIKDKYCSELKDTFISQESLRIHIKNKLNYYYVKPNRKSLRYLEYDNILLEMIFIKEVIKHMLSDHIFYFYDQAGFQNKASTNINPDFHNTI